MERWGDRMVTTLTLKWVLRIHTCMLPKVIKRHLTLTVPYSNHLFKCWQIGRAMWQFTTEMIYYGIVGISSKGIRNVLLLFYGDGGHFVNITIVCCCVWVIWQQGRVFIFVVVDFSFAVWRCVLSELQILNPWFFFFFLDAFCQGSVNYRWLW